MSSGGQPSFMDNNTLRIFESSGDVVSYVMNLGPRVSVFGLKLLFVYRCSILADDDLGYTQGMQILIGHLADHTTGSGHP